MTTKLVIAAALASLSLAGAAYAGEGNGEPFPFHNQGVTAYLTGQVADTGSAQYPAPNPATSQPELAQVPVPQTGSEGGVETANSLPPNFEVGTLAYAQAQHMNRWFAEAAQRHLAQRQHLLQRTPG